MNASLAIDEKKYGRVLGRELPRPIRTDHDLERAIARLEEWDERDESLSPEERELAELYTSLIGAYENQRYPIPHAPPHEFLRALLEDRGLSQADIAPLLGGRGHASEILSGKRSISKAQAKSLAAHFGLSVEVFI
jgi:HTH-type transcriptional regulator/antitoxin HigA